MGGPIIRSRMAGILRKLKVTQLEQLTAIIAELFKNGNFSS